MQKLFELEAKGTDGQPHLISLGIANTEKELDDIFFLRWNVYSKRGYIAPCEKSNDGRESDDYDKDPKTTHFMALCEGKLIGYIRLIRSIPLPTESIYSFEAPSHIANIPPHERAELGRFIITPLDKERNIFLPRGLVMLMMFHVLSDHALRNNIKGGYAFIKRSLWKKMRLLKVPFEEISIFTEHYPANGVLFPYFSQAKDPVIPISYLAETAHGYTSSILDSTKIFLRTDTRYALRSNVYTKFLSLLGIL